MNPLSLKTSIITQVESVTAATASLLGSSEKGLAAHHELEAFRREVAEITERRGLRQMVISVAGVKNSGKSWLCQSLIQNESIKARVKSGPHQQGSTDKLMWIGEECPEQLDHAAETVLTTDRGDLVDLGTSYMLLDMPGHNEADERRRQLALRSITLAALRVGMFSMHTLADESNDVFLAEGDGATLLPLIIDDAASPNEAKAQNAMIKLHQRLTRRCPHSKVLQPVLIPSFERAKDMAHAETEARSLAIRAVRDAVSSAVENREGMLTARFQMLRKKLHAILWPVLQRLQEPWDKLQNAEKEAVNTIMKELLGDDKDLERTLHFRLLWKVSRSLPPLKLFPYVSFMKLWAVFTGAMDKLLFGMFGSLPSLALSAFQAVSNVKNASKHLSSFKDELKSRAQAMILEKLAPAAQQFDHAMMHALPSNSPGASREREENSELLGVELLCSESAKIFETEVRDSMPRKRAVVIGMVAVLVFWVLAAGPLLALYQSFLTAWLSSFHRMSATVWQAFPIPSAGYIFGNLLLVMFPVLVAAFIACLTCATDKRIQNCARKVKAKHEKLVDSLGESGRLLFVARDSRRDALLTLLSFLKAGTEERGTGIK